MGNFRFLLYAHNIYGLGHLTRICALARGIKAEIPNSDIIIISGARLNSFLAKLIPQNVEFIKLPTLMRPSLEKWSLIPEKLKIDLRDIFSLRTDIVSKTFHIFKPHVIMADGDIFGLHGEFGEIYKIINARKKEVKIQFPIRIFTMNAINGVTHSLNLGLSGKRDIFKIDDYRKKVFSHLDKNYEHIFLGATEDIFWNDYTIPKSQIPVSLTKKTFFCGFITNVDGKEFKDREKIRRKINLGRKKLIVIALGSGRVGFDILKTYFEVFPSLKRIVKTIIFPGPSMSYENMVYIDRIANKEKNIHIETFNTESALMVPDWMDAADLFIGKSGSNTIGEILTTRARSILISQPKNILEGHEFIWCDVLKKMDLADMIDPGELDRDLLLKKIKENLDLGKLSPNQTKHLINGSLNAAKKIKSLIKNKRE